MGRVLEYLSKQPRSFLSLIGLVLIFGLGWIDYVTGPDISLSIFYLIPVLLITWLTGREAGVVWSVLAALAWLAVDLLAGKRYTIAIHSWNATVRLGFFLIATYTLSALKASKEQQEALRKFIVHDLQSPLGNVIMGLQALRDTAGERLTAAEKDLVVTCLMLGNRMGTLINSLLDLAYLEGGQMPIQFREVNVRQLVESSWKQVSLWAERRRVTLNSDLDPEIETMHADPGLAERVLVNLLSNAIKFSAPESLVTIRTARVATGMVAFSVVDQGQGFPEEWTDQMLGTSSRAVASTAGSAASAGVGLTFCRLAVERLGGRLWLERGSDKGAAVTFTLPLAGGRRGR